MAAGAGVADVGTPHSRPAAVQVAAVAEATAPHADARDGGAMELRGLGVGPARRVPAGPVVAIEAARGRAGLLGADIVTLCAESEAALRHARAVEVRAGGIIPGRRVGLDGNVGGIAALGAAEQRRDGQQRKRGASQPHGTLSAPGDRSPGRDVCGAPSRPRGTSSTRASGSTARLGAARAARPSTTRWSCGRGSAVPDRGCPS